MAERRMFAKSIIMSDGFLDMPASTRCLYFTLAMFADDDGFINNPRSIMRQIGAAADDMNILIAKQYVIVFDSGVIVIKHWRVHNYIRSDRYKPTIYQDEKSTLLIGNDREYVRKTEISTKKYSLIWVEISPDEYADLSRIFIDADTLIDNVHNYVRENRITIDRSAYRYIVSYANNKNWPRKQLPIPEN